MKIPDNFILLIFALVVIVVSGYVPENGAAGKMLGQLWALLIVLITPGAAMLPGLNRDAKAQSPPAPKDDLQVEQEINKKNESQP